jgi:hypothetical protein
MKFVRTLLATTALMTFFALSLPSFAQEQTQERDRMKAPPASITGCLTKGESGDQWVLVDSQSGAKMAVTGAEFDKHANHTVKVTGTPSEDGKSFAVAKIEHVADSCPAK